MDVRAGANASPLRKVAMPSSTSYHPVRLLGRFVIALFLTVCGAGALTPAARGANPPACDSNNGGITLPAGFCAFVAADGLGEARHLAAAPNGDLYVALMNGGVAALRDTNGDGRFEMKEKFGSTSV